MAIVWLMMPLVAAAVFHVLYIRRDWYSSPRIFLFAACWGVAGAVVRAAIPCVELCDEYASEVLPALLTGLLVVGSHVYLQYFTRT